jgi:hypothetical protein
MEEAWLHSSATRKAANSGLKIRSHHGPTGLERIFPLSSKLYTFSACNHVEKRFLRYSLPVERAIRL